MNIFIKKLNTNAEIPTYKTKGASGADLYACLEEDITINPSEFKPIKTGISVEIPNGFEIQVRPRSGLALKYGITVLNSPGTIDSDYRGELLVILINHGKEPFIIKNKDRIAQIVLAKTEKANFIEKKELTETERNKNGFGSTGI